MPYDEWAAFSRTGARYFAKYTSVCGRPTFFRESLHLQQQPRAHLLRPMCNTVSLTGRAIAVVRDPYKTLLAEYQRFTKQEADRLATRRQSTSSSSTTPENGGAHTAVMRELDPTLFYKWAIPAARRWVDDWRQYTKLAKLGRDRLHFVRYEELMVRSVHALHDLVDFVMSPGQQAAGAAASKPPGLLTNRVMRQQLICAFDYASAGTFKRPSTDKSHVERRAFLSMTPGGNETTACALWREFGALASRLGYAPPHPCGSADLRRIGCDILALADRARTAGQTRPRSLAAPVDSRILLPACGPQRVSVRVKNHGTYVAVARLTCEHTLEEESSMLNDDDVATTPHAELSSSSYERTTLVALQVIQTKSAAKNAHGTPRYFVKKRLYEKKIEVPKTSSGGEDWQWRGFGSLALNPGSFDVVVEGASNHEKIYRDECRVSHVALVLIKNSSSVTTAAEAAWLDSMTAASSSQAAHLLTSPSSELHTILNPLVWDCGEGATSKTNKRRSTAVEMLRRRAIKKVVIVTVASRELAAIALNWAIHLERNSIFNYAIGALDDETAARLGATLGGPIFRVPTRESRHAASFFDVTLGVPELSVLYVDVRAILISNHIESVLGAGPGMRCAPVSHCSTLLWLPRVETAEGLAQRERLVEELSVLRALPESRTASSLAPLDKPAWPTLNAALNSLDFVSPLTWQGKDVVRGWCATPLTDELQAASSFPPSEGIVLAYALCPKPLQFLKKRLHAKRLKVYFEAEHQVELGWALTPYSRFVVEAAAKVKNADATALSHEDFFSDLLSHLESLTKSPPRDLLKLWQNNVPASSRPALTIIVRRPRAVSMQAQVEALGAAAYAAETRFELVFVHGSSSTGGGGGLPYKPFNLWASLGVVLVADERDYTVNSDWVLYLANDALLSTEFGLWFARFRRVVDPTDNVRVVAPCVATVNNLLYGSSSIVDKSFDRFDCADGHTIAGKLQCHAWLADNLAYVSIDGTKRLFTPQSSPSAGKSAASNAANETRNRPLMAAGQLAVQSIYARPNGFPSLATPRHIISPDVKTTRALQNCWDLRAELAQPHDHHNNAIVFDMRPASLPRGTAAHIEVLPSAIMVIRHEESRPAAMPVSAQTKTRRYERITPGKTAQELQLLNAATGHRALELLAAMNVFIYAVEAIGGLANRLRALSTAWVVASKMGRPLVVSWPIDAECEAQPSDLFDLAALRLAFVNRSWPSITRAPKVLNAIMRPLDTLVHETGTKRSILPPRAQPERGAIFIPATLFDGTKVLNDRLERPVHFFTRTQRHAVYSRYWSSVLGYTNLDVRGALLALSPSEFVASRIGGERTKVASAVGLHIRMQWNETEMVKDLETKVKEGVADAQRFNMDTPESLKAYQQRRNVCNLDNFKRYVSDKVLNVREADSKQKIFVACDVPNCVESVDTGDRTGHIIRDLPHHDQLVERDCWRDSRSSRCQQLAFVDLYLLASCAKLIISKHSSFSDIASMLSVSFRPSDDLIFNSSPRDMSVPSACGFLNDVAARKAAQNSTAVLATIAANMNFNATAYDNAAAPESRRWRRPTRAEAYRKQLYLIQAARRKQQQNGVQPAVSPYANIKARAFGQSPSTDDSTNPKTTNTR